MMAVLITAELATLAGVGGGGLLVRFRPRGLVLPCCTRSPQPHSPDSTPSKESRPGELMFIMWVLSSPFLGPLGPPVSAHTLWSAPRRGALEMLSADTSEGSPPCRVPGLAPDSAILSLPLYS